MIPWWAAILVNMAVILWSVCCIGIGMAMTTAAMRRQVTKNLEAQKKTAATASGENVVAWPERGKGDE